jgi:hypothetical protein
MLGVELEFKCKLKQKLALYLVAMHCCALCTNLAIQAFSSLCVMQHLENLLESFHSYFARSLKKVLKL